MAASHHLLLNSQPYSCWSGASLAGANQVRIQDGLRTAQAGPNLSRQHACRRCCGRESGPLLSSGLERLHGPDARQGVSSQLAGIAGVSNGKWRAKRGHGARATASAATSDPIAAPSTSGSTLLFNKDQVLERLSNNVHPKAQGTYKAMYSSVLGGIVTDPALMFIPLDDHGFHRGHAVFDTAEIYGGFLYGLDPHLDRLISSAGKAGIPLPYQRPQLKQILIDTVAASDSWQGQLRYWVTAGQGGFNLSSKECIKPNLYAMVISERKDMDAIAAKGVRVITSQIPIKAPQFATVKSTNYLPNALLMQEAEAAGVDYAIWLDQEGLVAEGPNMNVAFVNDENVLLVPAFDKILPGITIRKLLSLKEGLTSPGNSQNCVVVRDPSAGPASQELSQELCPTTENGSTTGPLLKAIRVGPVTVEEARKAKEMMLIGSGVLILPVVEWDGRPVNDGAPGPIAMRLRQILHADMEGGLPGDRIQVPYIEPTAL